MSTSAVVQSVLLYLSKVKVMLLCGRSSPCHLSRPSDSYTHHTASVIRCGIDVDGDMVMIWGINDDEVTETHSKQTALGNTYFGSKSWLMRSMKGHMPPLKLLVPSGSLSQRWKQRESTMELAQ